MSSNFTRAELILAVGEPKLMVMSTEEVAKKVVELCRKQAWSEAVNTLYAKDIVSVEAHAMGGPSPETRGIEGVRAKTEWWSKNMEVHSSKVSGPFVAHDRFVVQFDVDVADKESKKRMQMSEGGRLYGKGRQDRAGGISSGGLTRPSESWCGASPYGRRACPRAGGTGAS